MHEASSILAPTTVDCNCAAEILWRECRDELLCSMSRLCALLSVRDVAHPEEDPICCTAGPREASNSSSDSGVLCALQCR